MSYSKDSNEIELDYYIESTKEIYYSINKMNFRQDIYSVSFSNDNNKIYVCLLDKKIIKIIDYFNESNKDTLKLSREEIKDDSDLEGHFNKCIYLNNDYVCTIDASYLTIWYKFIDFYTKIKKIKTKNPITDILLVKNECFILSYSSEKKIDFYDIVKFNPQKEIKKIDCINSLNSLFLIDNYIIINCYEGIAIISFNTKELVQYIKDLNKYYNKKICIGNNNIYIINNSDNLIMTKMILYEGLFIIKEEYTIKESKENGKNDYNKILDYNLGIFDIIYNNGAILLMGKSACILKEENND